MSRAIQQTIAGAFRHAAAPLAWYYAVTLAIPIANGAATGVAFFEHALIVLIVPPALIGIVCAIRVAWRNAG